MLRSIALFALVPVIVSCGCSVAFSDIEPGVECVETVTVLADLDAVSELGFAPAELLAFAVGEHSSAMVWGEGVKEGFATVSFGPESGDGMLTATIAHQGGEARYIASKPAEGGWDGEYDSCADRIEIDVEVTLASAGGALMESFVASLRGNTAKVATLHHEIEVAELGGSLELTQVEPEEVRVGAMRIELGISEGGLFGGMTSVVDVTTGDDVTATLMTYATWPGGDSPCEFGEAVLGLEDSIVDFTGADALALVAAAGPLQIAWAGGEPVALTFALTHDGEAVCGRHEGEGEDVGALRLGAQLMVASGDGRWMGSFPIQVSAQAAADGSLASVYVGTHGPYADSVAAAEFAAVYGLEHPELADYDRGILDFGGTFTPAGEGSVAEGALKIIGVTEMPCAADANGCTGDDYTDLESAVWSTL